MRSGWKIWKMVRRKGFWVACAGVAALLAGCGPRPYRSVPEALGMPGAEREVTAREVIIRDGAHTFVFARGKRPARVDGMLYYLHSPAGMRTLNAQDCALLRAGVVEAPTPLGRPLAVMLDAGHGGTDTGCRAGGALEKDITIAVALEAKRLLEAAGCRVWLTRNATSPALSLEARTILAAGAPIDAFVSIHVNSAENQEAKGIEVYTLPAPGCEGTAANSPARPPMVGQNYLNTATRLAISVQRALLNLEPKPEDRGVRHAHFRVLRDTPAPAVLVEMGFLTNAEDFKPLTSPEGQQRFAAAIASGVLQAFAVAGPSGQQ